MITAARNDASKAAKAAKDAYDAARQSAMDAREKANDARDAANQAKDARTGYAEADKQATDAETAADNAEGGAGCGEDGFGQRGSGIHRWRTPRRRPKPRGPRQTPPRLSKAKPETQQGTAATEYDTANTAAGNATTASGTHVMSLFKAASGAHVMDDPATTTVDEKAAHVKSVGAAMAVIAKVSNGNQAAGTTATASWPGDIVDDPTTDQDESSEGMLSLAVRPGSEGAAIPFELRESKAAVDLNNDGDTDDTGESARIIQTARKIADLGVFQGYDIWEDDGAAATGANLHSGDGARVIVFTNKTQDASPVAESGAVTARDVENVAVSTSTLTKLGTKVGNTYTGAEYTPTGETAALTGTLTCPSGTTCSVDATTANDGTVTINGVTGYVFSGSRTAKAAVEACDANCQATANNDYLAFGLWLDESNDGATDTFGSFATGGTGYAITGVANEITGTAEYSGKAAGAHHKTGEGVNWFDGDASLTANFGTAAAAGTISGMVSNIRVNGGAAMSTPIYLGQANLANNSPAFNGAAFMGAATAPGASTHEFDGTWSGSFFGATADDDTTDDVNESHVAPKAAAGTFGVTKSVTTGTGANAVTTVESYVGAFGAHKQ